MDAQRFMEEFEREHTKNKKVSGPNIKIGKRYQLENGDIVKIKEGSYWGKHGVSNYWSWYNETKGIGQSGYGDFYYLKDNEQ